MVLRGKFPLGSEQCSDSDKLLSGSKLRSRQVLPGSCVRTISKYVLGVRADVEVPSGTLGYFRYRWGFLILRRHAFLPSNLVRWLTRLWKGDSTALMLKLPVRYSVALRRMPSNTRWVLRGFVPSSGGDPFARKRSRPHRSKHKRGRLLNSLEGIGSETLTDPPSSDKSDDGVRLC